MPNTENNQAVLPPQNLEAESSLLGALFVSENDLPDVIEIIHPEDFYDQRHQHIFRAMWELYDKRRPVDLLTVKAQLKSTNATKAAGGVAYLSSLATMVPTAAHATAYAEIIAEAATRRRLIDAAAKITEKAYTPSSDTKLLLDEVEKTIFSVSQQTTRSDLIPISELLSESFDRLESLHQNKGTLAGYKTGFVDLDRLTAGFHRSDLIVLAARPAMGKTALALNFAHNVASINKQAVLIFSLEMGREQLINRMLANTSGINSFKLETGNFSGDDFTKISEAMAELSEDKIFIDDTPGLTVLEMRTKARRKAHEQPLGLIIVDYLQLMSSSSKRAQDNRVQEVSEISRGLKLIARELNVPVIALSQLSRSVESRSPQVPMLSDLRESGSIEQDADIVMFMYREDYYNPETERQNITDLIVAKHRRGATGKIELFFDKERVRFVSLDREHEDDQ